MRQVSSQDSPLAVVAKGLAAGMLSAVAVTLIGNAYRRRKNGSGGADDVREREEITAGEALADRPDEPPNMNRVTATFVQKIATGIFGTSLNRNQRYAAGFAWHVTYGGFWGIVYALLRSSLRLPTSLLLPLHGLLVWGIGPGWLVPKMKLMLPPDRQEPRTRAMVVGIHAVYAAVLAAVFDALRGDE